MREEENEDFIGKWALTRKDERNIKENIITNKALKKQRFFRKTSYCSVRKNNYKYWACEKVGHYANERKNRKNNKLIESLGGLNYFS